MEPYNNESLPFVMSRGSALCDTAIQKQLERSGHLHGHSVIIFHMDHMTVKGVQITYSIK